MNVKSVVENKEKFQVELTIEVGQEEFEAGLDQAYRKSRGNISVPGFRKGKAPRKIIEGMYGSGVFYEDAINIVYPSAYEEAVKEQGLGITSCAVRSVSTAPIGSTTPESTPLRNARSLLSPSARSGMEMIAPSGKF